MAATIERLRSGEGLPLVLAALLVSAAGIPAFGQSAAISATSPASLNQGNLRRATLSVTLSGTTFNAGANPSHFSLTTGVSGLTVDRVSLNTGRTVATLRLHHGGADFNSAATIAVTAAAAGTGHSAALTTGTVAVAPARWVQVSKKAVALTEGGSAGTYTVHLESPPTGNVTVTVTSDNAQVSRSPATPTFNTTNWATPQTVTVTPVDDNSDAVDEVALVKNAATGGGHSDTATASRTVRVTVDDDERTGTGHDADDDGLIEVSTRQQLNAIRHDLGRQRLVAEFGVQLPGEATGMGCPDGDAAA